MGKNKKLAIQFVCQNKVSAKRRGENTMLSNYPIVYHKGLGTALKTWIINPISLL